MSDTPLPVSAAFITLDEEANIADALASVSFCDDVVVVDSGSDDATVELARAAGARVVHQDWLGFRDQKNAATAHCRNEWVLSLDADERVSPELAREIRGLWADGEPRGHDAWEMPRLTRFMGRWIRHSGWYPDRKVRLYHRDRARWVGGRVHERVEVDGSVGRLRGRLLHHTYQSVSDRLRKMDLYSGLAARDRFERGRRGSRLRAIVAPPLVFFKKYVLLRGALDGMAGFVIAASTAWYHFVRELKLLELEESDQPPAAGERTAAGDPPRDPPAPRA